MKNKFPFFSMTSKRLFFNLITVLLSILFSSCNFVSVTLLVKNKFGKAVIKGDPRKTARYSTPEFAKILKKYPPNVFKNLIAIGMGSSGSGSSKSGSSSPSVSYHSFSSSKNRALFVAKLGKTKLKFYCRKVRGNWKVDDMITEGPKGASYSFRGVLGIFATFLHSYNGFRHGKFYENDFSGRLGLSVSRFSPIIFDLLKKAPPIFGKSKKSNAKSTKKEPLLKGFGIKTGKKGGVIVLVMKQLKLTVYLDRNVDIWKFREVKVEIKGKNPVLLSNFLNHTAKLASFYVNIEKNVKDKEILKNRVLQLFSPSIKSKFSPFIDKSAGSIRNIILSYKNISNTKRVKSNSGSSFDINSAISLLKDFSWEEKKGGFKLSYKSNQLTLFLRLGINGKINQLRFRWKKLSLVPSDFSGFIPWLRLVDEVSAILTKKRNSTMIFTKLVSLLTLENRKIIEKYIPKDIPLPVNDIVKIFTVGGKKSSKSKSVKGNFDLTKLSLEKTNKTFKVEYPLFSKILTVEFSMEDGVYRLKSLIYDKTQVLDFLPLIPPVLRLYKGLVKQDATMISSSFDDIVSENLKNNLDMLFRIEKRRLRRLGSNFYKKMIQRLMVMKNRSSVKNRSITEKQNNQNLFPEISRISENHLVLKFGESKFSFLRKKDGSFGLGYTPCGKKYLKRHKSRCFKGYKRKDPFQFIELLPLGVAYLSGIANKKYRNLRVFSTHEFYLKVWKKLPPKKLDKLLKDQKIEINFPKASELVDFILPLKKKSSSTGTHSSKNVNFRLRGFIFKRGRKFPFAELWIQTAGKKIDLAFAWDKSRKRWLLDDVKIKLSFLGKVSVKTLVDSL